MPRPFNRRQARENAAFLRLLAETGNAELSARECGLRPATLKSRRKVNGVFAAEWEAALVHAQARLARDPAAAARAGKGRWPDSPNAPSRFKTAGGEPAVTRLHDGRLQLRRARRGGIGFGGEQAFLRALAACGNIAMAAQAIGVAPRNIYARRARCPLFRAEMDKAVRIACERLEAALLERTKASLAWAGADDLWGSDEPPPLPPVTVHQAIMLLHLHQRRAALGDEWGRYATRARRGPLSSHEIAIERQIWWAMETEKRDAAAERQARGVARVRHYERTGNWFLPGESVEDALPRPGPPRSGGGHGAG